jgi:hypothetical protein
LDILTWPPVSSRRPHLELCSYWLLPLSWPRLF